MELLDTITVKDYQKICSAVGWEYIDDKEVKKALKKSHFLVSAKAGGEIVGMARIISDRAMQGTLVNVAVLPKYQGQGVGRQMIKYLLAKLQEFVDKHDVFLLELLPTTENISFYVKCGFNYNPKVMSGCYLWLKSRKKYKN